MDGLDRLSSRLDSMTVPELILLKKEIEDIKEQFRRIHGLSA